MIGFWSGFEKRAGTTKNIILGATGVGAAYGLADAIRLQKTVRNRESTAPQTKTLDEFIKKLEPGDLIYTSYKVPKNLSAKEQVGKMTVFLGGHDKYHVGMHTGGGKMTNTEGMGDLTRNTTLKSLLNRRAHGKSTDYLIAAYRPKNMSLKERTEAAKFTKKFVGTKYPDTKDFAKRSLNMLAHMPGDKKDIKPGKEMICTDLAVAAYPDKFKKRYMAPVEMQANKEFTPVALHGTLKHEGAPAHAYKGGYPALSTLSGAGIGATIGLGAAGLVKGYKMLKHGSQIDAWIDEANEEASKNKPVSDSHVDPLTAQMSFTPDTYFRGNP